MKNHETADVFDDCKRFAAVLAGSLFVQIAIWAVCDYLDLSAAFCAVPSLITALLYHGIQQEENTGLSRKNVFFAAVLIPFLAAMAVTGFAIWKTIAQDLGSADMSLTAKYAARLCINGVILLVFAWIDRCFLRGKGQPKRRREDEKSESDASV